jgi:two-component system chemotaxis sensor kinase CheA
MKRVENNLKKIKDAPNCDEEILSKINDIAATLIQIGPEDHAELKELREKLANLINTQKLPTDIAKLVQQAIEHIDRALGSGVDKECFEESIKQVNERIEKIIFHYTKQELSIRQDEANSAPGQYPHGDQVTNAKGNDKEEYELPAEVDESLLKEFIVECLEFLENGEAALLLLESDPGDKEAINTVFRAFHTIKGTAGFIGLKLTAEFSHQAENFFSRIRDGEIRCIGAAADLSLQSIDMMKALTLGVQDAIAGEPISKPDHYDLLMEMLSIKDYQELAARMSVKSGDAKKPARSAVHSKEIVASPDKKNNGTNGNHKSMPGSPTDTTTAGLQPVVKKKASESFIRIRTDRMDTLIDMVGELVIAQSMISQDEVVRTGNNHELLRKVGHAAKIIREFQDLSLAMRMIPLRNTFQTMARLARDLSHKKNKLVEFVSEGEDTEIDRNMVELIKDPLVHMIRNALDHGIETPEKRRQVGKAEKGTLKLTAYHSGGNVLIEITDDGQGLDKDKLLEKAVAKGIIEQGSNLSESEILNLIFAPGFSTADQVSDISGRGVGLDVVRRNIESLNGHIDILSEKGVGCTFTIRIPLTLAITDGMLVQVGDERYIVPTQSIQKTLRPSREMLSSVSGRGELLVLRDQLLPLFRLYRLFEITGAVKDPTEGLVIIIGDGNRRCAILVDALIGKFQVVVKALGGSCGKIRGIAGAAILGDGRVGLIIDAMELVQMARLIKTPEADDGIKHIAA